MFGVKVPYEFDGPYSGCFQQSEIAMDRRHIYLLHEVLRSIPFVDALEVGSAFGASATAFVEAMKFNHELRATFCDPFISDSLRSVLLQAHDPSRVTIAQRTSVEYLAAREKSHDIILLDGLHDFETVSGELSFISAKRPLVLVAHDTSATLAGYPAAEGAEFLRREVTLGWGWFGIEDNLRRQGEETHRGLFMATPSKSIYERLQHCYQKWCYSVRAEAA